MVDGWCMGKAERLSPPPPPPPPFTFGSEISLSNTNGGLAHRLQPARQAASNLILCPTPMVQGGGVARTSRVPLPYDPLPGGGGQAASQPCITAARAWPCANAPPVRSADCGLALRRSRLTLLVMVCPILSGRTAFPFTAYLR